MFYLSTRLLHVNLHIVSQSTLSKVFLTNFISSIQIRNYAARKGTRERKKKAKVKQEIKKIGFIPHNQRNKEFMHVNRQSRIFDDSWKKDPIDNVYPMKYYKWIVYPFTDAVKAHRETHHPEMYNKPNADLYISLEMNMQGEKKTRFVDNFNRIAGIPHPFDHGEERTVIAFAKNFDSQKEASEAGAQLSGGGELIKQIQAGQVSLLDFQHIVAHPDILPELLALRGIMKRRFPNIKYGTLAANLGSAVVRLLRGINYTVVKDEYEKSFGQIDAVIGTLNMNETHLEENFAALIKDVYTQKPKSEGPFVIRCLLWSPPSREKLKIDHNLYIDDERIKPKLAEKQEVEAESVAL